MRATCTTYLIARTITITSVLLGNNSYTFITYIFIGIHVRIKEFIRQQVILILVTSSESRGSVAGCSSSYFKVFKDCYLFARILDAAARIKINSNQQHATFVHELHSTLELTLVFSNKDFEL